MSRPDGEGPVSSGTTSVRYADVDARKSDGATYTPGNLARFVAERMIEHTRTWPRAKHIRVLDPAVGEGALAVALLDTLRRHGFTNVSFLGLDTDARAAMTAIDLVRARHHGYEVRCDQGDFLAQAASMLESPDLFARAATGARAEFDLIIANPPYVRTQVLGGKSAQALAKRFSLGGRVDLYHAFLLAIADALSATGVAGIIVSNRFMTTKAGGSIRERLPQLMRLRAVWDLGDSKLFDAAVLPAVLVGSGTDRSLEGCEEPIRFTSMYSSSLAAEARADDPVCALACDGVVELKDGRCFHVQQGVLDTGSRPGDVWRLSTDEIQDWLAIVRRSTRCTFRDLGKIRVGVKTTADKVFIREDWTTCAAGVPELLRPLITHHIARRYRAQAPTKQILYPHRSESGRCVAIDLADYPQARAYLSEHRQALEARKYVAKAGRRWYEVWVPQDPSAWERQKLVFRDISERPVFWIDTGGAVVNGDCYWLAPFATTNPDWLWLSLAVANSTFCEIFYDRRFNNKLYAGRRRFITQYVEHFPLPDPETTRAKKAVEIAKRLHAQGADGRPAQDLERELDGLVWSMFGLSPEEPSR